MSTAAKRDPDWPPDLDQSLVLAAVDDIARNVILKAHPVEFETAQSDEDRRAVYRLRYAVVIERGWARPEDLPDGLEQDDFDNSATHIMGWHDGNLVATSRIVFPSPGKKLPTETTFGLEIQPRGKVADMSRQIARPSDDGPPHRLFAGLLGMTWLEIRQRGFSLISGDFSPSMLRLYRMLGFEVTQLGPGDEFWGETRYPILVDVAKAASKLRAKWG